MTGWRKRTIMEMAREAGFEGCAELTWENVICTEELEAFAALVREDALAEPEQERNFCPRCGKRTRDLTHIHTCTPPEKTHDD
jgi:hypothetical protein